MATLVEEQQLYENLCLLGICGAVAKPLTGSQGLDLKPTTFRKPSSRAIEFVLYHVYAILLGEERANKDLRSFFPVNDASMAKEFNGRVSDWLKTLKDQNLLEMNSIVTASQLRSASGYRLVGTLLDLSCLALQHLLRRIDPASASHSPFSAPSPHSSSSLSSYPPGHKSSLAPPPQVIRDQIPLELLEAAKSIAVVDVQAQVAAYKELAKEASEAKDREEKAASSLRDSYYALKADHQTLGIDPNLGPESLRVLNTLVPDPPISNPFTRTPASLPPLPPSSLSSQDLKSLLLGLKAHLGHYHELKRTLDAVVTSHVHPNAIDGALLASALSGGGGDPLSSSSSSSNGGHVVDLSLLLDTWSSNLKELLPHLKALSGVGKTSGPHPLVAPPTSASSHSALLSTQLSLHKEAAKRLRMTAGEVRERIHLAQQRVQELRPMMLMRDNGCSSGPLIPFASEEPGGKESVGHSEERRFSFPSNPSSSHISLFPNLDPTLGPPSWVKDEGEGLPKDVHMAEEGGEGEMQHSWEAGLLPPPHPLPLPPPPSAPTPTPTLAPAPLVPAPVPLAPAPAHPAVLHIAQKQLPKGIVGNFNSVLSQLGNNSLFQQKKNLKETQDEGSDPTRGDPPPQDPPLPPPLPLPLPQPVSLSASLDQWNFKPPKPALADSNGNDDDVAAASRDTLKASVDSLDNLISEMEVDNDDPTPSAEDIGAVLRALDCTPLTFNPGLNQTVDLAARRLTFGSSSGPASNGLRPSHL